MMRIFYCAQMLVKINIVILLLPGFFVISMENSFPFSEDVVGEEIIFADNVLSQEAGYALSEDLNSFEQPVIDYNQEAIDLGSSLHSCPMQGCPFKYTELSRYQNHLKSKHGVKKPYVCVKCGNAFISLFNLQEHERTHTGERPYKCSFKGCGQSFASASYFKKHERIHTGERPYKCSFKGCGQAFANSFNLNRHAKVHTEERSYKCSVEGCKKAFVNAFNLSRHAKVHAKDGSSLSVLHKRKSEEVFIEPLEKFNIQALYTPLEPLEVATESSLGDIEGLN